MKQKVRSNSLRNCEEGELISHGSAARKQRAAVVTISSGLSGFVIETAARHARRQIALSERDLLFSAIYPAVMVT